MKKYVLFPILAIITVAATAQTSIMSTNAVAHQVLLGNYTPGNYQASTVINKPNDLSQGIHDRVSPDSLKALLEQLSTFETRHTSSDTTSATRGIGAARRWVYSKFEQYSAENENRLIPSYLQFDLDICGVTQHRNIFAVLPGADNSDKSVVIIEGHIDSRCEGSCDTACIAEGMEDNASGTALVMELARVMSRYTYNHNIVFLITIGEEQGLHGARAFANYCKDNNIPVKAVLNNDVVGGIICGQTASPPGCMGAGTIDSTNLRLFSAGVFYSDDKQLARYTKLEYKEQLQPIVDVPMTINVLTPQDRSGRGGDHIPFSDNNFTAIRFCAANEHGDAGVSSPTYTDRQHTSSDVLGVDTDNDNIIDSFFVNFNYLARMAVINGNTSSMIGISPKTPDFDIVALQGATGASVYIKSQTQYPSYRVALRSSSNDWDTVLTIQGTTDYFNFPSASTTYFVSVASVDADSVESLFSEEKNVKVGIDEVEKEQSQPLELLQNRPNPFDGETVIAILADEDFSSNNAYISITNMNGKEIQRLKVNIHEGMNEVTYRHGYNMLGTFIYTLVVDGKKVQSRQMIFAN